MCGGAQNLQIECVRMLYASETCLDVVKRDPSLKTRIRTSPNSSGVLSYGSEMVLRGFAAVFATDPGIELVRALYCNFINRTQGVAKRLRRVAAQVRSAL